MFLHNGVTKKLETNWNFIFFLIRPINQNKECVCLQGTMCKTCKARTVDVTLERSKVLKTTHHAGHTNAYDDRTKPVSSTGQTTYSTRHIPVVTGKYADSSNYTPTKGQGDHDTAEIVPDRQNTDQNVFPGYTESFHGSLPHYQETLHGWQEMLLVLLAILILLVISTFVSLCVVYFCQRRRISANQNERFSNHSVESVSETRRLSSAEIDGQGVYSSMCQKMDVIRNSPTCQKMDVTRNRIEEDDHFHEVRDSGFYNRDDDSDVMPDTGDGSVLGDKLLTNCDSICDLSNGAFIADSLVWADMDKDMSTSVRTTYPWYSEKDDGQSSQKHLSCGKNTTQTNSISHHPPIAKLKKDIGHDQNSQCNSKSKIGTRLAWKASTLTLMSHKTNYIHAKTDNSEHSGLLQAVEIVVSKNEDKYPVTFPLNFAESAETINVCGEDEWKFSEYVAPSNSAYSNRGYNTKYTHNKDNNDAISLGEISI
ncbi:uncharacterized protein [Argopecten irradians]|uniref:uncharacterized protein isoform X2 n=1 Tax=Argopecten irradians TaxID=31199 RepID=UPI00371DFA9E